MMCGYLCMADFDNIKTNIRNGLKQIALMVCKLKRFRWFMGLSSLANVNGVVSATTG